MTRQRLFLDMDCVEAARARIRHVYDTFDTVCVQFSGGKDSSAVLYLAKEVHEERGLGPVKVIFRDEEMVSPRTAEYIERVRNYDWVDMEWYCLPYGTEIWVLGRRQSAILWSSKREKEGRLIRPMPPWAIRAEHFGLDATKPLPESVDYYTMQGKQGSVAFITGVRANESMIRYRSLVQKLHENYIVTPYKNKKGIPLKFAKVIYDWQTNDVFKFLSEEHNAEYCSYYDVAAITDSNSRVGIPLHSVAIRRIGDVVATEPEFYDRLVEVFPYIDAQRLYWSSIDTDAIVNRYAKLGFDGASYFIEDYMIGEHKKRRAKSFVAEFRRKHLADPKSYTMYQLIRTMLMGSLGRSSAASPIGPKTKAHSMRELEFGDDGQDIYGN
jgi:predicted phosphoadenosine phosphosulfate sulfurtransferase